MPFQLPLDSWERKGHECLLGYTKSILLIDQKGTKISSYFGDEAYYLTRSVYFCNVYKYILSLT